MTQEEAIAAFKQVGREARPCAHPDFVALKVGEAVNPNEKFRATADGHVLVVRDGHYWQVINIVNVIEIQEEN